MNGMHLIFEISRGRIESGDVKPLAACFDAEKMDRAVQSDLFGRVTWSFSGYDDLAVELYGIAQVRSFLAEWRRLCPHWLFFGSLETDVLKIMYLCLLTEATATCHRPSGQCRVEFDRCEMGRLIAEDLEVADRIGERVGLSAARRLHRARMVQGYFGFG